MGRLYKNFAEAYSEVTRDVAEMGVVVHPQTMQDKYVADDPDYETLELQNYMYTILNPSTGEEALRQVLPSKEWAKAEFMERISKGPINPGEAWKHRREVWDEYMHDGKFAYTYNERMYFQLLDIMKELKEHPDSRQLYLSIWNPVTDIPNLGGGSRVPCSLGYLFQNRGGQIHMTYMMRSCDMITHYANDVYLAIKLLEYVSAMVDKPVGRFTHYIGSFHAYRKDMRGIF
jgi:thymidylate synthase